MNRDSTNTRPWYFWPLIALLVGILVGLIIGWGIWPVKWTNAYPQDLRAAERNEYLAMVAESYASNRDLELAKERLATWPATELAEAVADVQEVALNTDARRAADVQLLSSALNLSVPSTSGPATSPAAPVTTQPTGVLATLRTVCTAALWIVLVLGAIALFVYLFRWWRASQQGAAQRSISDLKRPPERTSASGRSTADIFEDVKAQWPETSADYVETPAASPPRPSAYPNEPDLREEEYRDADLPPLTVPRVESPRVAPRSEPVESRREPVVDIPKRTPPPPSRQTPTLTRLGDFIAVYQGEGDYDEAFDINDPIDGYMGQCGLQLNDPVGRDRDQAVALQAWLWDSSDPDTRVKVLMSEGAYRDTSLRSEQAGEHEALPVRPGTEFALETHDLLLRGVVEQVSYTEQEPYRGVFAELRLKLEAYRKS